MEKALDINSSVWVSASAGSGKTTVLVNRLLMLLLNDIDVSKILCITFTKTAAAEMKERIYKILSNWTFMTDEEIKSDIKNKLGIEKPDLKIARTLFAKIIDNVDNLKILTIHSFCQQIIARFPIEAGVYPNFELIEEVKSRELIEEAFNVVIMDKNIEEYFKTVILTENEDDFFTRISDIVNNRRYLSDNINYDEKLKEIIGADDEIEYEDKVRNFFEDTNIDNILKLKEVVEKKGTENQAESYGKAITDFIAFNGIYFEEYISLFLTKDKHSMKKPIKAITSDDFFLKIYEEEAARCKLFLITIENLEIYKFSKASLHIALAVLQKYKEIKVAKGFLDFDDLLTLTYKLLNNSEYSAWVNYKLDNGIEHLLLDEAQDTSTLQWKIIEKLTEDFFAGDTKSEKNRTIFIVGDEKQSIFSFQGANPEMFEEEYINYYNLINSAKKTINNVKLDYSYRSLKEILTFVDTIFDGNEDKISKLEKQIKHKNVRNGDGFIELWPLVEYVEEDDEEKDLGQIVFDDDNKTKKQALLSKYIAQKIYNLVNSNRAIVAKDGNKRPIKYGDIMILSKNRNKILLSFLIAALNKMGIPNSGLDKIDLFDNIIIKDFIFLLTFIIFNDDDLSLANIIKSPIFNLKEKDLFNICDYKNKNNTSMYDALKICYPDSYDFLQDILENTSKGIYGIINYVSDRCRQNFLSRFGNDFNLIMDKFYDFIIDFEKNNSTSLIDFVNFVNNNSNEIKKDIDINDDNCVKIMTAHASKGLQAPIVFLCEATMGTSGNRSKNLWYKDVPVYNKKSYICDSIKSEINNNDFNEYCRLLYVAATRAENELYICGLVKKNSKDDNWYTMSKTALEKLKAEASVFDFDDKLQKITYGKENFLDNVEKLENNNNINGNVIDLKIYQEDKTKIKKIIAPSQFYNHVDRDTAFEATDKNILMGKAIHKLLEVLPNTKNKDKVADLYLNNMFASLENKKFIKNKVFDVLNKFNDFYGERSKAEVPIIGEVDGNIVSGRIDRLIEYDDKIVVLDYKNTKKHYRTKDDLPQNYVEQLNLYRSLLEKIYGNKKIFCYILITSYGELVKL